MNVNKMHVTRLKQELTKRGLPTDGLKPTLVERLQQVRQQEDEKKKNSNEAFHSVHPRLESKRQKVTEQEREVAELEGQLTAQPDLRIYSLDKTRLAAARLAVARTELDTAKTELSDAQHEFKELESRLSFSPKLPTSVLLSILGQLGKKAGERAACVKREWKDVVQTAKALGMYRTTVLSVAAPGAGDYSGFTVVAIRYGSGALTEVYSWGGAMEDGEDEEDEDRQKLDMPQLGHGGEGTELLPRMIETLVGKEVIGVSAGAHHTAVWTKAGEIFTFGNGDDGKLGHGAEQHESVPRLVEALAGEKVVGAAAGGEFHTAVWTGAGELFTFGLGGDGKLGHGGQQNEPVPRLVETLAGKKVIGAVAGTGHTAVWTEAGELFTFGGGDDGELGHGEAQTENVPKLVEALAGEKVVGAAAGHLHTVVWTDAGELFTFGDSSFGQLGHGGEEEEIEFLNELVPKLVETLAGKQVIGASASDYHTVVWTETGEIFTFGRGELGQLGHGEENDERAPRLVETLAGKKVIGAAAGTGHTAVWTEAGELFTFGAAETYGQLGHGGGEQNEYVPRLVEAMLEAPREVN